MKRFLLNFLILLGAVCGILLVSVLLMTVNETLGWIVMFALLATVLWPLAQKLRHRR